MSLERKRAGGAAGGSVESVADPCALVFDECRMKIIPTAVATGADIGLSNLSLKTITLTLYSEFFWTREKGFV